MNKDDAVLQFLVEQEGFEPRTYIPTGKDGKVIGPSGLTFGGGIDIGQMNLREFKALGLSSDTEESLLPYVGKKGAEALKVSKEIGHFNIDPKDAKAATLMKIEKSKNQMRKAYPKWDELSVAQQAVGLSMLHNFGGASLKYNTMKAINSGDLPKAISLLKNPEEWSNPELQERRNREADLLQSYFVSQQQQEAQQQAQQQRPASILNQVGR